MLILDEATSSIDTRTEKLVQDGMDKLMHGRTTFVIAHRLSTVRNSDCIMVLENGRIIERGTHDQLIEEKENIISCIRGIRGNWRSIVFSLSGRNRVPHIEKQNNMFDSKERMV